MKLTKQQLKRIIKEEKAKLLRESSYEGRYFDRHGTMQYRPDEQFDEELHLILDTSPSEASYWRQAYALIEALDDDERYEAEAIAEEKWARWSDRNYDYRRY